MNSSVVNLARYRRRKLGRRPVLGLLGLNSTASTVLRAALEAVDLEDRVELFDQLTRGTYTDMITTLVDTFEIEETRAVG